MSRRRTVHHPPPEFYTPPVLNPTPPPPEVTRKRSVRYRTRTHTISGATGDLPRYLGKHRIKGGLQYIHRHQPTWYAGQSPPPDELWLVYDLSEAVHGIDGLEKAEVVWNGLSYDIDSSIHSGRVDYWFYDGTQVVPDPNLKAVYPAWNEVFEGAAYVVVRLIQLSSYWGGQLPEFWWTIRGDKTIDPRTGTPIYTPNAVVQWYDTMLWEGGKNLDAAKLTLTDWTTACDVADELVGGRKRFESHVAIDGGADVDDVCETFRLMTNAWTWFDGSQHRIRIDRPRSPVAALDDSHIIHRSDGGSRGEPVDKPNVVRIKYLDEATWSEAEVESVDPLVTAGTLDPIVSEYDLPWVHSRDQALSLAHYTRKRQLFDLTIPVQHNAAAPELTIGDVVTHTFLRRSIAGAEFAVIEDVLTSSQTRQRRLFEYHPDVYTDDADAAPSRIPSTLPDPLAQPPDVGNVTLSEESYLTQGGTFRTRIVGQYDVLEHVYLDSVEVWAAVAGGTPKLVSESKRRGVAVEFQIDPVQEGLDYEVTIYQKGLYGEDNRSPGVTVIHSVVGADYTPPPVSGLVIDPPTVNQGAGQISWQEPCERVDNIHGASYWSAGPGLSGVALSRINDGNTSLAAFTVGASDAWVIFDAGVGQTKEFIDLLVYGAGGYVDYSDDGVTWQVAGGPVDTPSGVAGATRSDLLSGIGGRRYWRVRFTSAGSDVYEVQFRERGEAAQPLKGYNVYQFGTETVHSFVPSPRTSIVVGEPLLAREGTPVAGSQSTQFEVRPVSWHGKEGLATGINKHSAWSASTAGPLVLVNGLNSDVALEEDKHFYQVEGPSAAFSIGGLKDGPTSSTITIQNSTLFPMTIVHESAGSSPQHRIRTISGLDITVPAGWVFEAVYDPLQQRYLAITSSDTEELITVGVRRTSGQSIDPNTWTTLLFTTEDFDDEEVYDPATGVFTSPVDRSYMLNVTAVFSNTNAIGDPAPFCELAYQLDTGSGWGAEVTLAYFYGQGVEDVWLNSSPKLLDLAGGHRVRVRARYDGGNFPASVTGKADLYSLSGGGGGGTSAGIPSNVAYKDSDNEFSDQTIHGTLKIGSAGVPEEVEILHDPGSNILVVQDPSGTYHYTIVDIKKTVGNILTDESEATLALSRRDSLGNSEFIDFFNNGYDGAREYGLVIQKRGAGEYRDFKFLRYNGTTWEELFKIWSSQASPWWNVHMPFQITQFGEAFERIRLNNDGNGITMGDGASPTDVQIARSADAELTVGAETLAVSGDTVRVETQKTPASADALGTKGDIVHDENFVYVCTATNTWKRAALYSWGDPGAPGDEDGSRLVVSAAELSVPGGSSRLRISSAELEVPSASGSGEDADGRPT